jgi:DNA gyrase subunit B
MSDEIRSLTVIEAIRSRPDMYVQADESGSVPDQLLQATLCHPLAEIHCGSASNLSITISGLSARIADDGPGWPVHLLPSGRRFAETLLSELYACRNHKEHAEIARSLCRITLPVVVALSERFILDVFREGQHWQQSYRGGVADSPFSSIGPSQTTGTVLAFTLDPQFCSGSILSPAAFSAWLATLPPEIPRDSITLHVP